MYVCDIMDAIDGQGTIVDNNCPSESGGVYEFKKYTGEPLDHNGSADKFRQILWKKVTYIGIEGRRFRIEV